MAIIDRVGRKALLLVGSVTFVISHVLAAWVFATHAQGWIVMAAMIGIVGSHAYSQGAVVWVIINELLPNAVRASGSARRLFPDLGAVPGVSWSFPVVAARSGAYAFGFFALMMVLQFFMVLGVPAGDEGGFARRTPEAPRRDGLNSVKRVDGSEPLFNQ